MSSIDLVLTLVYSSVLLLFFSYPAMRISEWLIERYKIDEKWYKGMVIGLTIVFSLLVAAYLQFG